MPLSSSGYNCILTVTDLFTKYIELYPMKDETALSVSTALFNHYISDHGLPISIHSDRGAVFESQVFQLLMTRCGIIKTRTTSYRPNCNGQVERFHKTLKDHLTRRLEGNNLDPKQWDTIINHTKLCYNATIHSTTSFSPFFLERGEEPLLPMHIIHYFPTNSAFTTPSSAICIRS